MNPYFVSGFSDGEGSFYVSLNRRPANKSGWNVLYGFVLLINEKDIDLLRNIHSFFGVGSIRLASNNKVEYRVSNIKGLINIIIHHFDKYPLLTQKLADFTLFKLAINIISKGEHLTNEGIEQLVGIKASMNRGLSSTLSSYFPTGVTRPLVKSIKICDPNWLSGFTCAEGCFYISIGKSNNKIGYAVSLWLILTQHIRYTFLFEVIKEYLGCGNLIVETKNSAVRYRVSKFTDNLNIIIPFFEKYPLQGIKVKDFIDFCKAAYLVKSKEHLTTEGVEKIKTLRSGMNTGREFHKLGV